MNLRITSQPGYGGDVIQFLEGDKDVYLIHRVWLGRPSEHREQRIKSPRVKDRIVSKGCINLEPEVYEQLRDCCIMQKLIIRD